jgi:predicted nucleic acid-binding protein
VELADTSVWTSRHLGAEVESDFAERFRAREIATCDMVRIELLYNTQDADEFALRRSELARLADCPIGPGEWRRALDVMEALARRGPLHHRQVPAQDLLIAAAAESARLPVVHYDRHFELIAEVTGQPVRAIAPLGSL